MTQLMKVYDDNGDIVIVFPKPNDDTKKVISELMAKTIGENNFVDVENLAPTVAETGPVVPVDDDTPDFVKEEVIVETNPGDYTFSKGKYQGQKIADVYAKDAEYVKKWCPNSDKDAVALFLKNK